jgi:cyclophilin family peptidyl-prolyl cis-trans isomerase
LYTVFGHIVEGMDVVHQIEAVPAENEAPLERVELTKVRIEQIDQR